MSPAIVVKEINEEEKKRKKKRKEKKENNCKKTQITTNGPFLLPQAIKCFACKYESSVIKHVIKILYPNAKCRCSFRNFVQFHGPIFEASTSKQKIEIPGLAGK